MHHDGEIDVRATYCVLSVVCLLGYHNNPLSSDLATDATTTNNHSVLLDTTVVDYVAKCQTWEGGFSGEPFAEAHGGYTFCAVAAIQLWLSHSTCCQDGVDRWQYVQDIIDIPALSGWLTRRQMSYEGGFNGRCNKLVDGCYSFWQGGATAIMSAWECTLSDSNNSIDGHHVLLNDPWMTLSHERLKTKIVQDDETAGDTTNADSVEEVSSPHSILPLLFDQGMLQRYILLCAQDVNGGLRDKPSKSRDFYHSCYNLSGLSISQHFSSSDGSDVVFGHPILSLVSPTHPCYNLRIDKVKFIKEQHFS
jgi:protein farnesyltransferase subunit beta